MALVPFGKFKNSLKFDARDSGIGVSYGPVYGNSTWVAIRQNNQLVVSADGINWNEPANPTAISSQLTGSNSHGVLRYINNKFVFVVDTFITGQSTTTTSVFESTDGLSWTKIATTGLPNNINDHKHDIDYSNSKYWIVAQTYSAAVYTAKIYSSTDNATWTLAYTVNVGVSFENSVLNKILVSGNTINVSGYYWQSGINTYLPLFIRSTNGGVSWSRLSTSGTNPAADGKILSAASNGSYSVAVGNSGTIWTNSSGTWTYVNAGISTNLFAIGYANSKWIAFGRTPSQIVADGYDEYIYTSSNGSTWTSQTVPSTNGLSNTDLETRADITTAGSTVVGWDYYSTNSTSFNFANYRIPNQQPYLDYQASSSWATWKTIDFWIYIESSSATYTQFPIVSQWGSNSSQWTLTLTRQGNSGALPYIELGAYGVTGLSSGVSASSLISGTNVSGTVPLGQWNHIRVVIDQGKGALFLNGQRTYDDYLDPTFTNPDGTFKAPQSGWPNTGTLNVGRIGNGFESKTARPVAYWIDEFKMSSQALNSPTDNTITVPTERWVNDRDTILLLHFDYNYLDDNTDPLLASSPLESTFTVQAQPVVKRSARGALTTTASVVADQIRIRKSAVALQASAQVETQASKTVGVISNPTATSSLGITFKRLRNTPASLQAQATQQTTAKKLNGTTVQAQAQATVTAQPYDFTKAQASITSQAQVQAQILRIKGIIANLQVTGFEMIAAVKTTSAWAILEAQAQQVTQASKTVGVSAAQIAQATVTAEATKFRPATGSLTVSSQLTIDFLKVQQAEANLQITTEQSTTATMTKRIVSQIEQVTAELTAEIKRSRDNNAELITTTSLTASISRTRPYQAVLQANTQQVTNTAITRSAQANFIAFDSVLADGFVLRYDPYYKLIIKSETRTLLVHAETRELTIEPETRVFYIKDI